ncbi:MULTISPECIES: response regulator [unclassified Chryseobacterium]|uniref:response regulator n=1 Tax=unclassified Chryseobacterium TaxID=2593645 RepID=UPI00226A1E05|nr:MULTISPECIES: response regulator [unclassified Chryseobacterium]
MNYPKVMVCDDHQSILDVVQLMLESSGFEVITEVDSTKLISRIKKSNPDILLLDLWMPSLSGEEILKLIRTDDEIVNLPVIVLSASANGDDIAKDAGADSFVPKPFDMDDLIGKIRHLTSN